MRKPDEDKKNQTSDTISKLDTTDADKEMRQIWEGFSKNKKNDSKQE